MSWNGELGRDRRTGSPGRLGVLGIPLLIMEAALPTVSAPAVHVRRREGEG
jgi:hypothetical protein